MKEGEEKEAEIMYIFPLLPLFFWSSVVIMTRYLYDLVFSLNYMIQPFIYTVLVTPFNMKGETTQPEDGFDAAQSMHNGVLKQGWQSCGCLLYVSVQSAQDLSFHRLAKFSFL